MILVLARFLAKGHNELISRRITVASKLSPNIQSRIDSLVRSVSKVILEGVVEASGFDNAEAFRESLLKTLNDSHPFTSAAHNLRAAVAENKKAAIMGQGRGPGRRPVRDTEGRTQAPRHDPSLGQKDRAGKRAAPRGRRKV